MLGTSMPDSREAMPGACGRVWEVEVSEEVVLSVPAAIFRGSPSISSAGRPHALACGRGVAESFCRANLAYVRAVPHHWQKKNLDVVPHHDEAEEIGQLA